MHETLGPVAAFGPPGLWWRMANERARPMRKTMTAEEIKLWRRLQLFRDDGLHFRKKVPFAGFVIDFVCLPARLAVELEGGDGPAAGEGHDGHRDAVLRDSGFRLLRFRSDDVECGLDDVTQAIYRAAIERLAASTIARRPSRSGGEGEPD